MTQKGTGCTGVKRPSTIGELTVGENKQVEGVGTDEGSVERCLKSLEEWCRV